jgi:His-Xaa-Ser system protein HxsD
MTGVMRGMPAAPSLWQVDESAVVVVDPSIFPIDAALRAAYKFTDQNFVWLERHHSVGPDQYCVFLRPKSPRRDLDVLVGEFINELIDQRLRHRLEEQMGPLRTIIAAQAFAEGNLLNPADGDDYRDDPAGAATRR